MANPAILYYKRKRIMVFGTRKSYQEIQKEKSLGKNDKRPKTENSLESGLRKKGPAKRFLLFGGFFILWLILSSCAL
jgi:hypothetical protein